MVEAVVAELRKLNAKAELLMQNEPKKEEAPVTKTLTKTGRCKVPTHRRKSINLSTDMIDNIAALEYISAERRVQPDQDQNQGQEIPWEALTEEERVAWYRTTLCTVSEWNQMMSEAEAPLDHSRSYGTAAAVSRYSVNSTPNSVTPAIGSTTPMSGMSGSAYSVSSAESDRLRLDTLEMSTATSPMTSEPSPLAASPAFVRNVPFRLTRGSQRGSGGSSASSRNLKRVLSGRDVLQEIRQTIRVTSKGQLRSSSDGSTVGHTNSARTGSNGESAMSRTRSRMRWAALRVVETTRAHLRKQIRRNKNFVRIFVSSTFRDFHNERDYLFQRVFPRLESACAERGILFIPVDLRWGVTEKEALDGEVIKLCLQEVDTCRPFFVAMLGERYGGTFLQSL